MNERPSRLLIATGNNGKLREFVDLLSGLPFPLIGLGDVARVPEPLETGDTFLENAAIKAGSYAEQTGEWVLADDSGLEVTALGGAPGVHSARFGRADTAHSRKIDILLDRMSSVKVPDRAARFVSVIVIARPDGTVVLQAEGECRGTIAESPRGANGFGYDPIFLPDGFDKTFGELSSEQKRAISHRGRASKEIVRKMLDFIGV